MKTFKQYSNYVLLPMLFVLTMFAAGCGGGSDTAATVVVSAPPTVLSTTPIDGDINVTRNTNITAFFDKELNASTVNDTTFTLKNGTAAVDGNVSYANNAMIFNPTADLNISTEYNATITTGVKDLAGNALATDYVWSFTTGTTSDFTPPTVVSTDPDANATAVPINKSVSAFFSETLDPNTVTTATFTLATAIGGTPVDGNVSYTNKTMIFNPIADLSTSTEYTATITTAVTDLASNAFAGKVWSFTTGATVAAGPAPVILGTAGNFVILTKTGVTNVHTSAIVGDIGSSPITAAAMDGVFCSEITGNIYGADAAYTGSGDISCFKGTATDITYVGTAVADMGTAYTDAAGRPTPDFTELHAGNLSGKTLVPGLYKWTTDVSMDATGTTLSGGANDVWIFQIAGDLIMAPNAPITLIGALPKNIFWQVAGPNGAIIGTTAQFKGVLLAAKAAAVNTGASVDGRLLVQTAVNLQQNAITQP